MKYLTLLLVTLGLPATAQSTDSEKPVKSSIEEVTVFLNGAEINRYGNATLTPGTTYDWKVVAVSEGVESAATTGMQTTSAATTYYWVGTSSAGTVCQRCTRF